MIPTPVFLSNPNINQSTFHPCHHPIFYCNNTLMMISLSHMRQSEWWNIQLTHWIWHRPLSHQPHPLIPPSQTNIQEETKSWKKIEPSTNHSALPWPMYTKPKAMRGRLETHMGGSEKINLAKKQENNRKKVVSYSLDLQTRTQHLER